MAEVSSSARGAEARRGVVGKRVPEPRGGVREPQVDLAGGAERREQLDLGCR